MLPARTSIFVLVRCRQQFWRSTKARKRNNLKQLSNMPRCTDALPILSVLRRQPFYPPNSSCFSHVDHNHDVQISRPPLNSSFASPYESK